MLKVNPSLRRGRDHGDGSLGDDLTKLSGIVHIIR